MTREEALQKLEAGELLQYESWHWTKYFYSCGGGGDEYGSCCYETFDNATQAVEHLAILCGDSWEDVK